MRHLNVAAWALVTVLLAALLLPGASGGAQGEKRWVAQSQQELNQQAYSEFEKADKELNQVYRKLTPKLDAAQKKSLVNAQLAWIKFRDADAECWAFANKGGSIYPMIYNAAKTRTTRQRIENLKLFLAEWE